MRNLVFGIIGVLWRGFILIGFLLKGGPEGVGAYYGGQVFAIVLGVLLLAGGLYYAIDGIRNLQTGSQNKKRKKPRPKRPLDKEQD